MPTLRPYQLEAAKEIVEKKRVLIADDMGLGKCAESIAARNVLDRKLDYSARTLITCPGAVAPHWADEIRQWYRTGTNTRIAHIGTSTFEQDVAKARGAEFAILEYSTLSHLGDGRNRIALLNSLGFKYGIIDEAHNAKNPDSLRSSAVRSIFHRMPYLAILSGTPIPNTVVDIYVLLNLLDRNRFPIHGDGAHAVLSAFYDAFRHDPEEMSMVIKERMLRRTVEEYLKAPFPTLHEHALDIDLQGDHRDTYLQVYQSDQIRPTAKLLQLLRASIDPNLVRPDLLDDRLRSRLGKMESTVYATLDRLLADVVDKNGKVLLFTTLKQGITTTLMQRYARYGAIVIDSTVTSQSAENGLSRREELRRRFQTDSDCKLLISTTVMDEGVDLTAATDIVHLILPYTPAAVDQRNRRSQRIGEIPKTSVTAHYVRPSVGQEVPFITQGMWDLINDKRRIITYLVENPLRLTSKDLREINNGHPERSNQLHRCLASPIQLVMRHFGQLKGKGARRIAAHYEEYPEEAQRIAHLYAAHWEGFYGGNTANLYGKTIALIAEKEGLPRMLDIASGPFSLSRRIGRPVMNVDLNKYMLDAGKLLEQRGTIVAGNESIQASFDKLPLPDESYDLAMCSLALHMSRLLMVHKQNLIHEREKVFREMNRVLRPGGYGLVTLPNTLISRTDLPRFYTGLSALGFNVMPFSGFYRGPADTPFEVYLCVMKKQGEPQKEELAAESLEWRMDRKLGRRTAISRHTRKHALQPPRTILRGVVTDFFSSDNTCLEDMVRRGLG